jgi:hypothetical protein
MKYKLVIGYLVGQKRTGTTREFVPSTTEELTEPEAIKRMSALFSSSPTLNFKIESFLSTEDKPKTVLLGENQGWRIYKLN